MFKFKYQESGYSRIISSKDKIIYKLRYFKYFVTIFTLVIIGYCAWHSRDTLVTILPFTNFKLLVINIILLISMNFILPLGSVLLLKSCSASLSYYDALKAHINYLPARYLPGSIWHSIGKMADYYSHGITLTQLTIFGFLENFATVAGAFILGGGYVWYSRGLQDSWGRVAGLAILICLVGLITIPYTITWYSSKYERYQFSFFFFMKSVAVYTLACLVFGFIFSLYMASVASTINKIHLVEVGGTYLFSWAVGFVSVFTPQGFGVTEFITGKLLTINMSTSSLAVLIAGFRVIRLMSDMCIWIIYKIFYKARKAKTKQLDRYTVVNTKV